MLCTVQDMKSFNQNKEEKISPPQILQKTHKINYIPGNIIANAPSTNCLSLRRRYYSRQHSDTVRGRHSNQLRLLRQNSQCRCKLHNGFCSNKSFSLQSVSLSHTRLGSLRLLKFKCFFLWGGSILWYSQSGDDP